MAESIKSYRDLVAWQKSMELALAVYRETAKLPPEEQFGLTAQARRCAVSVPSNIAEGWGRGATQDYIRFLRNARGSLYELSTQIEICMRLEYHGDWDPLTILSDDVRRLLHGLIRSLGTE
ncbi:MAG: four helix bundle protein [Planctomycetota bacterium]|jgi:four helix bundle protein